MDMKQVGLIQGSSVSYQTSPTVRRRVQNQRAQRNYRLREAVKARQVENITKSHSQPFRDDSAARTEAVSKSSFKVTTATNASVQKPCGAPFTAAQHTLLSADHRLIVVVHNNIIRGLISNGELLGHSFAYFCQDDSVSSFCHCLLRTTGPLPPGLQPTPSQCDVIHHPWIDLIPSGKFRENVLLAIETSWADNPDKETELCEDLTGAGRLQLSCHRPGMMIWGENAWDVRNWEITEEFANKWVDILDGCRDLIEASDYWKGSRGEGNFDLK